MSTLLEELNQLAALAAAASPEPWEINRQYEQVWSPSTGDFINMTDSPSNMAFAIAARNFLTPERIAELSAALSATPVVGGGGETDLEGMVSRSALHVREAEIERNCLALSELPGMRDLAELVAEADPQELQTELDLYVRDASKVLYATLRSLASPAPLVAAGAGQWVPVGERLPERAHSGAHRSVPVVACDSLEVFEATYMFTEKAWYVSAGNWKNTKVTMWQPLPAAPQPEATPRHAAHDYSSYVCPEVVKYVADKAKRHGTE